MSQISDSIRGLQHRQPLGPMPRQWVRCRRRCCWSSPFAFYLPLLNILPFAYDPHRPERRPAPTGPSVLFLIVVYMIVAVGLNVVIGLAGLLDLGYVGFYALGAYSVALFGSPSSPVVECDRREVRPDRGLGGAVRGCASPSRSRCRSWRPA